MIPPIEIRAHRYLFDILTVIRNRYYLKDHFKTIHNTRNNGIKQTTKTTCTTM